MSETNWASFIVVLNTLGMAFIGYLVLKVQMKIREVKTIVDGPLSLALKSNAELARKIAQMTGDHEDNRSALKAEIISENREEGKNGA